MASSSDRTVKRLDVNRASVLPPASLPWLMVRSAQGRERRSRRAGSLPQRPNAQCYHRDLAARGSGSVIWQPSKTHMAIHARAVATSIALVALVVGLPAQQPPPPPAGSADGAATNAGSAGRANSRQPSRPPVSGRRSFGPASISSASTSSSPTRRRATSCST